MLARFFGQSESESVKNDMKWSKGKPDLACFVPLHSDFGARDSFKSESVQSY